MNAITKLIIDSLDYEITKRFKPLIENVDAPDGFITSESFMHELKNYSVESFKIGVLLGMEIAEAKR